MTAYMHTHPYTHEHAYMRIFRYTRAHTQKCERANLSHKQELCPRLPSVVHKHACTHTKTAKRSNSGYLRPLLNYWKRENLGEKGRLSEAFILDVKRNPTALPLYQNLAGNNYEESWGYPELTLMISLAGYYILNIFYVSGTL